MSEGEDTRSQFGEEPSEDLELKDEEAEEVGGGSDFNFVKSVDKSSPALPPTTK